MTSSGPDGGDPSEDVERLSAGEIRQRATAGALTLGLRSIAVRIFSFLGNVALARLLFPEDFGLVAVGAAIMAFAGALSDGGLGAGLVRRAEPPDLSDYQNLVAVQLVLSTLLWCVAGALALVLVPRGELTVLMLAAMPIGVFRSPGSIAVERALRFGPVAVVEVAETIVFFGFAIVAVLLGADVWGLAAAYVVRSVVGSAIMARQAPLRALIPRPSWERTRGLLGFGLRFQGIAIVSLARDQGLNVTVGAVAGLTTLGLWTLAFRVISMTLVVADAMWRVSYSAMSRLVEATDDHGRAVRKMLALSATVIGVTVAALVASAQPLVPTLFGERWRPAVDVIPYAGIAYMIAAPVNIATTGYLLAIGEAAAVLWTNVVSALIWIGLSAALLSALGVEAIGLAWLLASLVHVGLLTYSARRHSDVAVIPAIGPPLLCALLASAGGWWAASALPENLVTVGVTAAGGSAAYVLLALLVMPGNVRETGNLLRSAVPGRFRRGAQTT